MVKSDNSPELLAYLSVLRAERKPANLKDPATVRAIMTTPSLYRHFRAQIIAEIPNVKALEIAGGRPPEGDGENQ